MASYKKIAIECIITRKAFYKKYEDVFSPQVQTLSTTVEADSLKSARDSYCASLMARYVELSQDRVYDKDTGIRLRVSYKINATVEAEVSVTGISKDVANAAVATGKAAARKARKLRQKAKKAAALQEAKAA